MSRIYAFEVTSRLEYFPDSLKDALKDWCNKNNYQFATIIHDKDIKHNDETNEDEKVENHRHFIVNTKSSRWTFQMLLQRFEAIGLKNTMLQNVRKGWNNALSYLTHRTENAVKEGKHLYGLNEVEANFDYIKTIEIIENQVEEKRTQIDEVLEAIFDGRCRRYNYTKFLGGIDYTKKGISERIEKAFRWVETDLLEKNKEREMKVYWIYGNPGIGKTTLAKTMCENNKWSYAISSSSNDALQDYNGQDCLILDDFRANGWSKTDVLKMLDNNTSSSIKSRYQNKHTCYLKCIIVTTIQSPFDFWQNGNWSSSGSEPYEQLKRRISQLVWMYKNENEGQFARTYFEVTRYGYGGVVVKNKYDFTEKLESIRKKKEEEEADISFDGISCMGSSGVSSGSLVVSSGLVDDKDVPF